MRGVGPTLSSRERSWAREGRRPHAWLVGAFLDSTKRPIVATIHSLLSILSIGYFIIDFKCQSCSLVYLRVHVGIGVPSHLRKRDHQEAKGAVTPQPRASTVPKPWVASSRTITCWWITTRTQQAIAASMASSGAGARWTVTSSISTGVCGLVGNPSETQAEAGWRSIDTKQPGERYQWKTFA